jgi:hypothetical protein
MSLANTSTVAGDPAAFVTLETARSLQSISSLNHLGVSYFNQGMYSDSVCCFREATIASKTLVMEHEVKSHEEQVASRCFASFLVMPSPTRHCFSPLSSVAKALTAIDVTSIERQMYSRPFEIMVMAKHVDDCKHEEHLVVDERSLFSKLSTLLIFNLAMSHHFMAVVMMMSDSVSCASDTTASAPRDLLLKSCSLYSLAYSIPQNEPSLGMIWPAMVSLCGKAILNNMGHCYASLDDIKNSVQCFEMLLKSIMLVQQDHIYQSFCEEEQTSNHSQDDTKLCFWDSTLFLMLRDPGFAPAA